MRVAPLLPHLDGFRVESPIRRSDHWLIRLQGRRRTGRCPRCHRRSARVHSRYTRRLADLPVSGTPVILHVEVRRFRCLRPRCARRTFVEPLPPALARPRARRTEGLRVALEQVGLLVGGRPGERLGGLLGLLGSRACLLRLVRQLPDPPTPAPRVVGVDEFARRKGRTYSTILVDVETHRPVDVLDDRSADQFARWLRALPTPPGIICRDRAGCYADGGRRGAPAAVQVADRYHVLANLGDAVERVLARHAHCWQDDPTTLPPPTEPAPPPTNVPAGGGLPARHQQRYEQIQALRRRGLTITRIGQVLQLDRKTVRKFVRAPSAEAVRRGGNQPVSSLLARYLPYVNQRWQEGCEDGAVLYAEVQAQGYRGSGRTLRRYLTRLRQGEAPVVTRLLIGVREVAGLVLRHPDRLNPAERRLLERLEERCPELATAHRLAAAFAEVVCQRQGAAALTTWLEAAAACGLTGFVAFAAGLRKDLAAVSAGVTLPWSSGVVEGTNTRIKLLKRMMYGRGGSDLLRKRILLAR